MVKVNTLTIFAIRDALIDNVKKYGPGAGFAFKIKRSDITLTHPRGTRWWPRGSFQKRKSPLVPEKNPSWKQDKFDRLQAESSRNSAEYIRYLEVKCDEKNHTLIKICAGHPSCRRLNEDTNESIENMILARVPAHQSATPSRLIPTLMMLQLGKSPTIRNQERGVVWCACNHSNKIYGMVKIVKNGVKITI